MLWRAFRSRRSLSSVANRTSNISAGDVLLVSTLRNERIRLPYFLKYYRDMGVSHFLIIDNGSDDGSREYLAEQPMYLSGQLKTAINKPISASIG